MPRIYYEHVCASNGQYMTRNKPVYMTNYRPTSVGPLKRSGPGSDGEAARGN